MFPSAFSVDASSWSKTSGVQAGFSPISIPVIANAAESNLKRLLFLLGLIFCAAYCTSPAHATTCSIPSGASQATIQEAITSCGSSGSKNTVTFAEGTYQVTGTFTVPCTNGLTITGPVISPPTAIIVPSYTNQPIFNLSDCTGVSIEYLNFTKTQSIKFNLDPGTWCADGCLIAYNQFTGLTAQLPNGNGSNSGPACDSGSGPQGNCDSPGDTALTFSSNSGNACPGCSFLTNTTITHNQFGDASSCLTPADVMNGTSYDYGGNCAGIQFYTAINGVTVEYNNFVHLEEGFHVMCGPVGGDDCSGSTAWTFDNFTADYNDFSGIHRFGAEMQLQGSSNVHFDHNSFHTPTAPWAWTFGVSNACCAGLAGSAMTAPGTTNIDNVLVAEEPPTGDYIGMADESWGNGALYEDNVVQGNWQNGFEWAYITNGSIKNNIVCGSQMAASNTLINQETTPPTSAPPTISGNTTGSTCSAVTSTAPAISASSGTSSGTQTVTLTDTGSNTGIWYTTDGSTPVPGSGTARFIQSGGTVAVSSTTTVKAVGMWGQLNQPKSYPLGLGYIPSQVVTELVGATGKTITSGYLRPKSGENTMTPGGNMQMTAYVTYSDGSTGTLPDALGNKVTWWNTTNHKVAKIAGDGYATALAAGSINFEALVGTLSVSPWHVTVVAAIPASASQADTAANTEAAAVPAVQGGITALNSGPVPAAPGAPVPDTFLGPFWSLVAPAGGSASIANYHLFIGVPGGANHDLLLPSNQAVRVVQAIGNEDFDVAVKVDSPLVVADGKTSQGFMVLSDNADFLTFALTTNGTNIGLNARIVTRGVATTVLEDTDFSSYQNPMYLRLTKAGTAYVALYSVDGVNWAQAASFTDTAVPTSLGLFASNYSDTPANAAPVVMSVNWFKVQQ
jgi:hypothetical protein